MIQTPSANIKHAAQKLRDIKEMMRKALLRLSETQDPQYQPGIEWVGSQNHFLVLLFHCVVPVATIRQQGQL